MCPRISSVADFKRRTGNALRVLIKYHGAGDPDSALVKFELAEIESQIELASLQKASSWKEWVRTKGNRKRLYLMLVIPFIRQWAGNNLVTYYHPVILRTSGITNSKTQLNINGGVNVCAFLFASSANFFVETYGRRRLLMGSLSLCLLSFTIWTILSALITESNYTRGSLGYGVVTMIFAFNGFNHITCR